MLQGTKVINRCKQRVQIIFDDIKNNISVYIEISVCNVVSYPYYINPRDFRTFTQQFRFRYPVQLPYAFTY